ncbi:MAG: hypothetical protein MRZ49_10585, partial [Lachnospiraceae bacterium]|nr:hypothetical protein [Lachnospiraceae bacterium]
NGAGKTNVCSAAACFSYSCIHSQTRDFIALLSASQTVCSLMAQKKQMSAPQPLVFPMRLLYHILCILP